MQNNYFNFLVKIILLSSISLQLFANDILTNYRKNGIQSIQKQMDFELMQTEYWDKQLKNLDTRFGYVESYLNILKCDKSQSTLSLYVKDTNNSYELKKKYSAYTGKIKGDKIKEGDLRTPVGVYNIIKKISKVDSFYGPMAFVTSYPNIYDKYRGKNGHGIWIHGLPTEQERDEFTKGCIAINNQSIECLDKNIDIKKTLLIISEDGRDKKVSKAMLSNILSQLYKWRFAWLYNDIDMYLSFYSSNFIRYDGINIDNFKKYKKRIFEKNEKKTIIFNDINIIPYPNTKNIYKVLFKEIYKSDSFSFTGNKVLIIKLEDKNIKIITEK